MNSVITQPGCSRLGLDCFFSSALWLLSFGFSPLKHTHFLFCVHAVSAHEVVTRILGTSIRLKFKFNVSITENSQLINVYKGKVPNGQQKVDEYNPEKVETKHHFKFGPDNYSIIWLLTNLTLNMSGCYWATVITDGTTESNKVKLIVGENNSSSTGKVELFPP